MLTLFVVSQFNFVHASLQNFVGIFKVLKKLGRRKLLYHSYSMQVHGYISLPASGGSGSFILVHGVGISACFIILILSYMFDCFLL